MSDTRDDHAGHADHATDDFVRRLLADARTDSPVPDDVANRLDETLAGLLAEQASQRQHGPDEHPSTSASRAAEAPDVGTHVVTDVVTEHLAAHAEAGVTDLSAVRARRRRRTMVGLASAAAFVVAAGVALPTLLGQDSADRAGSTATDQSVSALGQPGPVTLRAASAQETVEAYVAGLDQPVATPAPPAASSPLSGSWDEEDSAATTDNFAGTAAVTLTCEEPGPGEVHPATYDGKPAVLVLTGTEDDSVLARVVICGGDRDDSRLGRMNEVPVEFVVPQP